MHEFEYVAPKSLADAISALGKSNGSARLLAGGTDLIDQMRMGRYQPKLVIDVKKIPELTRLDASVSGLRLGAAVPCRLINASAEIARDYTALKDSTHIIGGIQIQNRASVGGNLCNSGPAADSTPSLIALGAVCVIVGPQGTREVPVAQFCTAPGKNVLQPGEMLVELKFPAPAANSGSAYERFIPRYEMDIAVVGVGAAVTLDAAGEKIIAARIGLGAVGPTPIDAASAVATLIGQPATKDSLERAADAARALATPINDMRGTVEFRKHATGVLTRRVLELAIQRARKLV
jgi:CO/xanthine dehydrogenase FAD-binding subunit